MELLDERRLRELAYGGAVLGAGGGGSIEAGLAAGREALALGAPRLVHIDELAPTTLTATLSIVGSVGGMSGAQARPQHELALFQLAKLEKKRVGAVIASEVGPQAVTYGWRESATTGIPIVDAPCNGRAHPLGVMGSLGLNRRPLHLAAAVAIGGSASASNYVQLNLRASATKAGKMIRDASATAGIPLAVARNLLPASYVRNHAAIGGLRYAAQVGAMVLGEITYGLDRLLQQLVRSMRGRILFSGHVKSVSLTESHGFTLGHIRMQDRHGGECTVGVCNEYLALRKERRNLATFPDLITIFDYESSLPLASPQVKMGMRVAVMGVPRSRLKLGSTMNDCSLLIPIERRLNLPLTGSGMTTTEPASHATGHLSQVGLHDRRT
jgi:DUF917 family protein